MRTRLTLACLALLRIGRAAPLARQRSPVGDWTDHGGDAGSTKYAPLDQITPANVGSLRIARACRVNRVCHARACAYKPRRFEMGLTLTQELADMTCPLNGTTR